LLLFPFNEKVIKFSYWESTTRKDFLEPFFIGLESFLPVFKDLCESFEPYAVEFRDYGHFGELPPTPLETLIPGDIPQRSQLVSGLKRGRAFTLTLQPPVAKVRKSTAESSSESNKGKGKGKA